MSQPKMTELDKKLQEMALMNWNQFVQVIGQDAIISAKICMLRQNKNSYGAIAMKLGIEEHQARYGCSKCEIPT